MKVKDTIEFNSGVPATLYKGVVTWIDSRTRELGVALIAPKQVRGGCLVIDIDEAKPEVVESYIPHTFRQDLSDLSEKDLRAEIEEIRESRSARKRTTTRKQSIPKSKGMAQLSALSSDKLEEILKGK